MFMFSDISKNTIMIFIIVLFVIQIVTISLMFHFRTSHQSKIDDVTIKNAGNMSTIKVVQVSHDALRKRVMATHKTEWETADAAAKKKEYDDAHDYLHMSTEQKAEYDEMMAHTDFHDKHNSPHADKDEDSSTD